MGAIQPGSDDSVTAGAPGSGQCLAIVTDDAYAPGARVALASFLERNPWFDGTIVIIHDGLGPAARAGLSAFPRVRLHEAGAPLRRWLDSASAAHPLLSRKRRHFLAIEAFGLASCRRVLLLDSDILCMGDAKALFATDRLLAAPDESFYWGTNRDRRTYKPRRLDRDDEAIMPPTFNTGVLAFSPRSLPPSIHEELVARAATTDWPAIETGHTVSVVLNRHFEGGWTRLPDTCNYFVSTRSATYIRRRPAIDQALFLHFLGRPKPWEPEVKPTPGDHRRAIEIWKDAEARTLGRSG